MIAQILQSIGELSLPVIPPKRWNFLSPVKCVRQLPVSGSALVEQLKQNFTTEQLQAAHVLVARPGQEQPDLSPVLAGEAPRGLFLRPDPNEPIIDIVNQFGSLATDDPPAFGAPSDHFTNKASEQSKVIFAAFTVEDLGILRMLGLPCTPAAGLAELTGGQIRRLGQVANIHQGITSYPEPKPLIDGYQLVLVGWKMSELANEIPAGLKEVVSRFLKAQDAYDFSWEERIDVWKPDSREFLQIRYAVEFGDRALVRQLVTRDSSWSRYPVADYHDLASSREVDDYGVARRELMQEIGRVRKTGFRLRDVPKRREDLNRAFDLSVVQPIFQDAMSAPNSLQRSLFLSAAELMRVWHKGTWLVRSLHDDSGENAVRREPPLRPEELKELLRIVDGLVKIHRELVKDD